jgi:hypothetical protein
VQPFGEARVRRLLGFRGVGLAQTRRFAHVYFGNLSMLDLCFLECLVAARLHDAAPWTKRLRLRLAVAARLRKLRAWARGCPASFEPQYLIARAGLREALALELSSAFVAARGDAADAAESARLREEAASAYARCGAAAKATALGRSLARP